VIKLLVKLTVQLRIMKKPCLPIMLIIVADAQLEKLHKLMVEIKKNVLLALLILPSNLINLIVFVPMVMNLLGINPKVEITLKHVQLKYQPMVNLTPEKPVLIVNPVLLVLTVKQHVHGQIWNLYLLMEQQLKL